MKKQFRPCRTCANKPGPKNKPGFFYDEWKGAKVIVECKCHQDYVKERLFYIKANKAGIWPESLEYNPSNDYVGEKSLKNLERFEKYVHNFEEYKENAVYLWGGNGTQKTTLAQWAGAHLLDKGYSVRFVLMQTLLMSLTSGFEDDEKRSLIETNYYKPDLLIVDESFGKDKVTLYGSGYQLPFLDRFLRERIDVHRKGILFISNVDSSEIEKNKFSKSIQDLVMRKTYKTILKFEDNYLAAKTDFNVDSLFD